MSSNNDGWFFILMISALVFAIMISVSILNSDLPTWVKLLLLR